MNSEKGWYEFKSGKRKGKVLELLMFEDYNFLHWFYHNKIKGGKEKNRLERHLEWLLSRGEDRQPKMLCPQCNEEPVKYFSVLHSFNDFSIGTFYTCCEKKECKERLRGMAAGKSITLYQFKFSILRRFNKTDAKRVAELYKRVFQLPKPLRREVAYKFFSE